MEAWCLFYLNFEHFYLNEQCGCVLAWLATGGWNQYQGQSTAVGEGWPLTMSSPEPREKTVASLYKGTKLPLWF